MIAGPASARKHGFAPVFRADAKVLVLGSLPGDASIAAAQYYAHPRNLFWQLIGAVIDQPQLPQLAYDERLACLLDAGIALWDAAVSAERAGSLDTAMRAAQPAPLSGFAATLPCLRAAAFNGKKSASLARLQLSGSSLALVDLPSSSPAHAAMSLAQKQETWLQLRKFLR